MHRLTGGIEGLFLCSSAMTLEVLCPALQDTRMLGLPMPELLCGFTLQWISRTGQERKESGSLGFRLRCRCFRDRYYPVE